MTHRILVVEDELITAADIQGTLEGLGYDVPEVVDNGEEAVRKAGELHPSLVLMDIGLKGKMNGIEAGKQIRERFDIPVIYLTAHSDESTFWNALGSQPFGYIIKPFEAQELKFGIEMALHKHEQARTIDTDAEGGTGRGIPDGGSASQAEGKGTRKKEGSSRDIVKIVSIIGIIGCIALFIAFISHPSPAEETQYEKNVEIVRQIAQEYHNTHTYLGFQNGQSSDIFVCIDMAKDVWNMIKTRGINAVIEVGNVEKNVSTIQDANHAWVLAEVGPMQWLAVETTGGFVVSREENPRYYNGMQFDNPAEMKEYLCGKNYCWSDTCVHDQCLECSPGFMLGADLRCHPECGSMYCTGNSVCVNGQCMSCDSGTVLGTDNECHPPCIDSNHYCLPGYVCGIDNTCHPASENMT